MKLVSNRTSGVKYFVSSTVSLLREVPLSQVKSPYANGVKLSAPGVDALVDMARYLNYAVEEGYNLDAQHWAASGAGILMIEARGGRCILRRILDQQRGTPNLKMRRLDTNE